jgi:hypothetical protein
MAIDTLYISHHYYDWHDNRAKWLTANNVDAIVSLPERMDCKTTVEDLGYAGIEAAVSTAQHVELVDFDFGKYNHDNFAAYGRLLNALNRRRQAPDFDIDYLQSTKLQRDDGPVLWTAGCSMTAAIEVEPHQAWRNILADKLNMPLINLAKGGTSIWWSADQLLRADLRAGDTVVWGLTNVSRIDYAENWQMHCETVAHYTKLDHNKQHWNIDYFESATQTLFCLHTIHQVINFCDRLGVDLYLANLLDIHWISILLKQHPRFIDLVDQVKSQWAVFIDYAADQQHPGPLQHQHYATQLYNFIEAHRHG